MVARTKALGSTAVTAVYTAWNTVNNGPELGDAANHTLRLIVDGVESSLSALPVEVGYGEYGVAVAANENTGTMMSVVGESSTANVEIIKASWQNLDSEEESGVLPECRPECRPGCLWVFDRVHVRPTIKHGARIEWRLHPLFTDPQPHTFQLEVGTTGLVRADDWQDVGLPAEDTCYLLDDTARIFGKTQWIHYRVRLETPEGIYWSKPQHAWGDLKFRHWRQLRNLQRLWLKKFQFQTGQKGYLLKRRLTGAQPELGEGVIDFLTEEITNPQAEETVGTEYLGGYYAPEDCVYAELSRVVRREHLDKLGTENRIVVTAKMLATPQLDEEDVWVDQDTDFRWYVHQVEHLVEIQGVPAVVAVNLRLAPFSDPIYKVEIADQVPA